MKEAENETIVTYALRLRATGEMLRVEHSAQSYTDGDHSYVETTYSLGTDTDYPIFTAGSEEELTLVFASGHPGSGRHAPYIGGYKPADLEPVVIEETVTRRITPSKLGFDLPVAVEGRHMIDVHPNYAGEIEGLGPVFEAFEACREDIAKVTYPGSSHRWGRCRLIGKVVAGAPEDLPEGSINAIVVDKPGQGFSEPRRAIAALPLPDSLLHLTDRRRDGPAKEGTLLICLSDTRKVPESLIEALAELRTGSSPSP